MRVLLIATVVVAGAYALLCLLLFAFQRSLLYFPQPRAIASAASTMTFRSDDAELVVSVVRRTGPKAVVYFGGNAEDVSQSLADFGRAFPEHAVFMLHYRGYGGSSGRPSEAANHRDAARLIETVRADHPALTVVGRSLGSGIAVRVAARTPVERLVLVTPYDSIANLAAGAYPFVPVRWLLRDRYESVKDAPEVRAPTTIVVAEHDEVIPRASSDALAARFAPGVAGVVVIDGTGHNTVQASAEYLRAVTGAH